MSMNAAALPVDLIDFTATPVDNKRKAILGNCFEINNSYFSVERSADALQWHEINKVNGAGNASIIYPTRYGTNNRTKEFLITA